MTVVKHAPAARGVNQLMYVGDAETGASNSTTVIVLGLAAIAGWWFWGRKKRSRER
jgi:LPXTG-motif cell wall-anchored protein